MANALRDGNYVPGALGVDSTNANNVLPFKINPVTGRILAEVSGSITAPHNSLTGIDGNGTIHLSQAELDTLTKTPSVSTTEVSSQGGLLINIDSASGTTATSVTSGNTSWVEDEKYGVSIRSVGSSVGTTSGQFVPGNMTGSKVFRFTISGLSNTGDTFCRSQSCFGAADASISQSVLSKNGFPLKPNTKYRFIHKYRINSFTAVGTVPGVVMEIATYNSSGTRLAEISEATAETVAGTYLKTIEFTSGATGAYAVWVSIMRSGNGEIDLDVNSFKFEEITEPVTNSLTSKSPSLVGFTAVGSTDNVDQSQTTSSGGLIIGNGTRNYFYQQFTPTKSELTGVIIRKEPSVGTFTGDVNVKIRTNNAGSPGTTVLSSYTIPNATWAGYATSTDYTITLPSKLTADGTTTYWLELSSTTSDASNYAQFRGNGSSVYPGACVYSADGISFTAYPGDFYFKTLYYKPSTNFTARQNNDVVSISADSDGFLEGAKIDLENGTFQTSGIVTTSWTGGTLANNYKGKDSRKFLSYYSANSVLFTVGTTYNVISPFTTIPSDGYVMKLQGLKFNTVNVKLDIPNFGGTNVLGLAYSYDGVNYTELSRFDDDVGPAISEHTLNTDGASTVFISLYRKSGSDVRIYNVWISGTFDTSSIKKIYNFPTNKAIYATYAKPTSVAVTTATYRATKFGFPAIEYSNGEYQFLKVDTTATGSVVKLSSDGVTYTTCADGAGIGLTSTTVPIVYTEVTITANRLYVSSNDYNADSAKDGSLKCNVQYKALTQGLVYDVQDLQTELNDVKKDVRKDYVLVAKSGGDFDTLYEAVNSGARNIFVKNGIYEETQMITLTNASTRIRGESREGTIIRAQNGKDLIKVYTNDTEITNLTLDTQTNSAQAAYVIGDGKAAGSPDYTIGNRNRLIGCTVKGSATTFAVFAAGASTSAGAQTITNFNNNQLQEGNVIEDNYLYSTWNGDAFSFSLQKNGSISRNKCYGGRIAFYMTRNSNCSDNAVIGSANQGIFVGAPSWDNVISGNSVYMPASAGIKQQNQLEHPVSGMNALRNAVFGNTVEKAGGIGIEINESQNCTFSNNTFDTPNGHGIYMQTASNNSVCGNVIRNPNEAGDGTSAGIFMTSNVTDNSIANNEIYDDRTGTYKMCGGIVDREASGCHGNVVIGNVIRGRNTERSIWITSNRWVVSGNSVEGGNYAGILVNNGSYNNVSSNILRNNTNESNNAYAEVWLQGTSVGNSVYGNTLLSDATNKAANGVNVDGAGVSNTWVGFNRIVGNVGSAIANTGTNTTTNALT